MEQYDISLILTPSRQYRVVKVFHQLWDCDGYDYRSTPRPECGILLVTQGSITYQFADRQLQATAGDLLFLPKGCHYRVTTGYARDYLVNFQTDAAPLPTHPIRLLTGASGEYVDHFQRLVELKLQGKQRSFGANAQFLLLLERLQGDLEGGKSSLLDKALPLLEETELPISRVAAECGISESGFRAVFHKAKGISPREYRLSCRLRKARYLLESTDLTVGQIAETLHFYDEAYFCKLFRQKTGCSPREYAKNQKL